MSKCADIVLPGDVLRRVAHAADGMRGKRWYFIIRSKGFEFYDKEPDDPKDAIVISCYTEDKVKYRPDPQIEVCVPKIGLTKCSDISDTCDALFWSESAVEKFAVPYYASLAGSEAAGEVTDLILAYRDSDVYGLVHLPKSDYVPELRAGRVEKTKAEDFFGVLLAKTGPQGPELEVMSLREYKRR